MVPLHREGSKDVGSNYRLISLLPVLPRVVKHGVLNEVGKHLINNEVLDQNQHSFFTGKSSEKVISFLDEVV